MQNEIICDTESSAPVLSVEERFNVVVNHAFGGWHHVQNRKPNGKGCSFSIYGGIGTWDFDQMTRLVIAAHAVRVRVEVGQSGPHMLKVWLHPRANSSASWSEHHPSINDLIAKAEAYREKLEIETPGSTS